MTTPQIYAQAKKLYEDDQVRRGIGVSCAFADLTSQERTGWLKIATEELARRTADFQRPAHYEQGSPYEAIKIIEHYDLRFSLGNALKYLLRAGKKPGESYVKDLKKAVVYLQFEIARAERTPPP